MGRVGAKRVAQQHNIAIEVGNLTTLFASARQSATEENSERSFGNPFATSRTSELQPERYARPIEMFYA